MTETFCRTLSTPLGQLDHSELAEGLETAPMLGGDRN
jgi:hypothetical protein